MVSGSELLRDAVLAFWIGMTCWVVTCRITNKTKTSVISVSVLLYPEGVSCTVKVVEKQESASGGSESAKNPSRLVVYPRCSSVRWLSANCWTSNSLISLLYSMGLWVYYPAICLYTALYFTHLCGFSPHLNFLKLSRKTLKMPSQWETGPPTSVKDYLTLKEYPPVNLHSNGKSTIWRYISY